MAAFKVGNRSVFHLLGSQKFGPLQAREFLAELFGDGRAQRVRWYFALFMTGGGLKVGENESHKDVLTKAGFIGEGEESPEFDNWAQFDQGWGRSADKRFVQIHEKIEQISQWS